MATNLLQLISESLAPQITGAAGRFLGASGSNMETAVGAAIPAVLGGLMQKSSTPAGAASLMTLLDTPGLDTGILGNLGSFLGGGDKTNGLLKLGGSLMSGIFGDKSASLANSVGSMSGLSGASASNLMAIVVTMVLAFLKRYVGQNRLDAGGLASLLAGQGEFLKGSLDSRITSALGFSSVGAFLSSVTGAAGRAADAVGSAAGRAAGAAGAVGAAAVSAGGAAVAESRSALSRWWPWILLAAIALILLWQFRGCGQEATQKVGDAAKSTVQATTDAAKSGAAAVSKAIKTFELPGGAKIEAPEGGFMASLIAFLNSKDAALGKGYSFDEVYFDSGSAAIKPESTKQLEQLGAVLKAYPTVAINIEGYTDNTGDAAVNKTLSVERASAVKKALEGMGVDGARIASAGYGPEKPIASNENDAGRALNRRVEVVVTKR